MAGILSTSRDGKTAFVPAVHMRAVKAAGGPGAIRQLLGLRRLTREPWGFHVDEFYDYGLWRGLPREALAAFVPDRRNRALNDALAVPALGRDDATIRDKLATLARLEAAGLPASPVTALYAPGRAGAPDPRLLHLDSREALAAFLSDPGRYPVFGKPVGASVGHGAASLAAVEPARDRVTLLTGVEVPLSALLREIVEGFAEGFLFQPVLRHPPAMRAHVGLASGTLRLTTVLTGEGPALLYAKLKLPAPTAMHDGHSRNRRAGALIDPATGRVAALRQRFDPTGRGLLHWQDKASPLLGFEIPHFAAALAAAIEGHRLFPAHGILGWDVLVTEEGPVLTETNANPFHQLYQRVAWTGVLGPALAPLWERARERAARAAA